MANIKSNTDSHGNQADTGRRSFMWKVGAGMSAVLAATVPAIAKPVISSDNKLKGSVNSLSGKVAALENEKSIRELHKTYEDMLDDGKYGDVLNMFTADAEVVFNGGVFKGKRGLKRLFCEYFSAGQSGKRMDQAPGFQLKPEQQRDTVKIAHDQKSAKAEFTYSIQVGAPIDSDSLLVKMSRLHGEGIMKWWEAGICKASYVRDNNKIWRMNKLEYRVLSAADYKPGKSTAKPINVHPFSKVFPSDPAGPDRLIS